jgi:hypothetical protein
MGRQVFSDFSDHLVVLWQTSSGSNSRVDKFLSALIGSLLQGISILLQINYYYGDGLRAGLDLRKYCCLLLQRFIMINYIVIVSFFFVFYSNKARFLSENPKIPARFDVSI